MTPDTRHLWRRGNQWYFRMPVPRPLQKQMLSDSGKPTRLIVKALGDSLSQARRKRDRLIVICGELFDRATKGELVTPKQIQEMLQQELADGNLPLDFPPRSYLVSDRPVNVGVVAMLHRMLNQGTAIPAAKGETINQAAEAWFADMQRDPSAAVKQATLDGHRLRVKAFVDHCGDIPLTDITRAMAADFLTKVAAGGRSNRTTNSYATTLKGVFQSVIRRGAFAGNNPFDGQKRKAGGDSYEAFEVSELQTLFDPFKFEVAPKHTPETALPWVSLIAAYTGMRLEEIAQLRTSDIRSEGANGSTVTVIDIHNGGSNTLKNESSARLVPVHSTLVRSGFLDYVKALPKDGPLFPGLARRASKGGKIGARLGELFRKRLEALGLKRKGLCFHSFRHTVGHALEAAGVSESDANRVLGHAAKTISYGVYSSGPGLKRLAAIVEEIAYPGFAIPSRSK
jgi:integrase